MCHRGVSLLVIAVDLGIYLATLRVVALAFAAGWGQIAATPHSAQLATSSPRGRLAHGEPTRSPAWWPERNWGAGVCWSISVAVHHQIGLCMPAHQQLPHGRHQLALCVIANSSLQAIDISFKLRKVASIEDCV